MSVDAKKFNNLLHAQSIRRQLNSYNFDDGLDFDYTTVKLLNDAMQPLSQATCHHRSYMHKASEAGSIGCTIAAEIVRAIIQPDPKTAQLFEQKFYGLFEHMSLAFSLKASKSSSIVSTKAFCLPTANLLAPRGLDSHNYCRAVSRNQKIQLKPLHDCYSLNLETKNDPRLGLLGHLQPGSIVCRQLWRNQLHLHHIRSSNIWNNPGETVLSNRVS
jgi:hypothetical protein